MSTNHLNYQPNGLYDPIIRLIREQVGKGGVPGVVDGENEKRPEKKIDHTHLFSELDIKLTYPIKVIRDSEEEITEVWMAAGDLKFKIVKDSYEDIIGYDVVLMDTKTFQVRILFTNYDPRIDPDIEDKGEIELLVLIGDGEEDGGEMGETPIPEPTPDGGTKIGDVEYYYEDPEEELPPV